LTTRAQRSTAIPTTPVICLSCLILGNLLASANESVQALRAISWYEQRIAVEKNAEARAIMKNAQKEEFKHFGMNLEFTLRRKSDWRTELKSILFTKGNIVKRGEAAENKVD
jgi:hypothetical protein